MKGLFDSLVIRFERLEPMLNGLDAATGDGDHGATMLKGLRAAAAAPDDPAKAFRVAAGGASGSLFGLLVAALDRADVAPLGPSLGDAARKIAMVGQAGPGDKTMLDALIPAAEAATAAPERAADAAASAARAGAEATRSMAARRGRAKHVEGAGVGHLDAGAVSVAEMLEAFATKAGGRA